MINIMQMKMFPFFTRMVSIPTKDNKPYNILFMSENGSFIDTYPKLNIRRQFAKRITAVASKIPRMIVTMKNLFPYKKSLGLLPVLIPDSNNVYIDVNPFLEILDSKYGKQSYKRPTVFQKIVDYLTHAKSFGDYNSILIYHVNMSKPVPPQFLYRRSSILALMAQVGEGSMPFENVILAIERSGVIKFTSIYNKRQKPLTFPKILSILKRLVPKEEDIGSEDESEVRLESIQIIRDESEKESILRFIEKNQKRKVLNS